MITTLRKLVVAALLLAAAPLSAQYYYLPSTTNGNPGGLGEGGIRTRGPLILWANLRIPVKSTVLIFSNLEFRAFPAATYSSSVGSVHVQQFS
jgi:hypothetical protein